MPKDKLKIYCLEFILLVILSFTLFVPKIYNKTLLAFIDSVVFLFMKQHAMIEKNVSKIANKFLLYIFGTKRVKESTTRRINSKE